MAKVKESIVHNFGGPCCTDGVHPFNGADHATTRESVRHGAGGGGTTTVAPVVLLIPAAACLQAHAQCQRQLLDGDDSVCLLRYERRSQSFGRPRGRGCQRECLWFGIGSRRLQPSTRRVVPAPFPADAACIRGETVTSNVKQSEVTRSLVSFGAPRLFQTNVSTTPLSVRKVLHSPPATDRSPANVDSRMAPVEGLSAPKDILHLI